MRGLIGAEHDVGVEHRQQPLEIAAARSREKCIDDLLLPAEISIRRRRRSLHAAAGAAGELPRRGGRAADDRRDLLEGDGEHIVQHEGEPLGRRQRFQHHQQRRTDGVRHLASSRSCVVGDGLRHVRAHRFLAPRFARAQHVETDARDHRGQPSPQVFDCRQYRSG